MKYLLPLLAVLAIYFTYEYPVYAIGGPSQHSDVKVDVLINNQGKNGDKPENFEKRQMEFKEGFASHEAEMRNRMEKQMMEMRLKFASNEARMKERAASREAELKQKLAQWQNKQKASIVERINSQLEKVNQDVTGRMNKQLDKLTEHLTKWQQDASTSATLSQTNIDQAVNAITTARAAVASQSAKSYAITVSDEQNAKADAKTARDNLFNDLKKLQEVMLSAKQAVAKVHQAQ